MREKCSFIILDSCPPLRRHLTFNGGNLKSWNAFGENSDFHHFHHFNRLPKWFRTRLFCNTFHWSVSRWFSMVLTISSLLLKVTLIMLSPPGSSGACVRQIPTELGIRISPKTRLSKEIKPDGLICIGIILSPSITGIRPSSLLGIRTEGWNKRSTYQARDARFTSAILSTWHWAPRILNTACARVAMSQAHSLVDIELRIGENSSESAFSAAFNKASIVVINGKSWLSFSWSDWQWGIQYGLKGGWLRYSQGPSSIIYVPCPP